MESCLIGTHTASSCIYLYTMYVLQYDGFFLDQVRGPPLPRPILPRERSAMDKVLEYLVGDGPQNRYALICRFCHSHNGMALKEEFEYISK